MGIHVVDLADYVGSEERRLGEIDTLHPADPLVVELAGIFLPASLQLRLLRMPRLPCCEARVAEASSCRGRQRHPRRALRQAAGGHGAAPPGPDLAPTSGASEP